MNIFCDFDGTISKVDTTDFILGRFALSKWEEIEEEWKNGEIGSGECMRQQISLIDANKDQLNNALDEVEIDSHFLDFVEFCKEVNLPVSIISDGVDYFIYSILKRYNLDHLPVISNNLVSKGSSSYELKSPNSSLSCESGAGVCKCNMVGENFNIYVGDGRSDFCVADKVDILFAKDKLAVYCQQNNIKYISYTNFSEVIEEIQKIIKKPVSNIM